MKLALIHLFPIEHYPPVCNMIGFLVSSGIDTHVYSSHSQTDCKEFQAPGCKITRLHYPQKGDIFAFRLLAYIEINISILVHLVALKPDAILYYEPHSALPAYLYRRFFASKVRVLIHHHEYYSKSQYLERGMVLARIGHYYERILLYRIAEWLSQTNSHRADLFLRDNPDIDKRKVMILPNYPSKSWKEKCSSLTTQKIGINTPYRCVYLGSLSLRDTYIKEFCEWVIALNGKIKFDIFSYNMDAETTTYVKGLNSPYISHAPQLLDYCEIPNLLISYNVGLVLYKCNTLNFVYNKTNKLFEYLCCGLDVWFPHEMAGAYELIDTKRFPKVICLDFKALSQYNVDLLVSRNGLALREYNYFYEDEYKAFCNHLTNNAGGNEYT